MSPPSTSLPKFRSLLQNVRHVVFLTGAGISAESGIPTYRGATNSLYTTTSKDSRVSLMEILENVFKNPADSMPQLRKYRREFVESKIPNAAHLAIAEFEKKLKSDGRNVSVITQNVDDLHERAGTKNILKLHGSLFQSRCLKCHKVHEDTSESKGGNCPDCGGILRPNVVWFGEQLDRTVMLKTEEQLDLCDLCLIVGTSSVVYPAAAFAPYVAERGVPVAEFNLEATHVTESFDFFFKGPCAKMLPEALRD